MFFKCKENYKNLSLPMKTSIWFVFCSFFLKGISFISAPIFTRILSTEEYGIQSVFYTYQQVFLIFATFELSGGAYIRGLLDYKETSNELKQSIILLGNFITVLVFILFLCFHELICQLANVSLEVFCCMFIYFLFYPSYHCWIMKNRFEYKYKAVVIMTIFQALLTTTVSVLAVMFIQNSATTKIVSVLTVDIFLCNFFFIKAKPWKILFSNRKLFKEIVIYALKFQAPLVFHSLSYLILAQADRMMISAMDSNTDAAMYSVAYSVAIVISIFQSALRDSFSPYRLQELEAKCYKNIKKTTNVIMLIVTSVIILYSLVLPEPYLILFPNVYAPGIYLLPVISTSMFFMALYGIFVDVEEYFHKTNYIAIASIVAAVLNVILNYFGMLIWSYQICAYTTLITYIVMSAMHFYFVTKILKANGIAIGEVFSLKSIFFFSLLMVLFSFIGSLIIPYILVRYLIVISMLIIAFMKRKSIMEFLILRR